MMCADSPRPKLGRTSVPRRVHVELDVERTEHTIGGQLAVAGAPPQELYGWLELIDRLERASTDPSYRDAQSSPDELQETP